MVSTPSPPPAPDPKATASAQTSSNVATATANARLSNADEVGPLGSVRYEVEGYQDISDGLGGTTSVPKYRRIETLSDSQQKLYDQQSALGSQMNTLAGQQLDRLGSTLNSPLNLDGLPEAPGDMGAYRQTVADAMFARLNPQLDRDRNALESKLIAQGLQRGTTAFNDAADESNRQANDARSQVDLASGSEARELASAQATARERALQERLAVRNQPISEITALMGGGSPTLPQFTPYKSAPMSEVPYGQYVMDGYRGQLDAWKTQAQQSAATMNGIGSLGSSLIGGMFKLSDERLKRNVEYRFTLPSGVEVYDYDYAWGGPRETGVLAQQVEAIIPEAVRNGVFFKSVDYSKVS